MGKWYGDTPILLGGDYTHGPLLQLTFNDHKEGPEPKPSDEELRKIGRAYGRAVDLVKNAREVYTRPENFQHLKDNFAQVDLFDGKYKVHEDEYKLTPNGRNIIGNVLKTT